MTNNNKQENATRKFCAIRVDSARKWMCALARTFSIINDDFIVGDSDGYE